MDFHPIPYRGADAGLEQHYIPLRGRAQTSMLSFFAPEQDSRVLCYANANLTRSEQAGEVLRFVESWQAVPGANPQWLYFDSEVATHPELEQLNGRGVWFVTIRRRGAAVVRRLRQLPASSWQSAVIDTPKRCHQQVRYVDEPIQVTGYQGGLRQVAVDGLGKAEPTLLLSNNTQETARGLITRYAGRDRVEGGLGSAVNFFHLDCLSSEVRLNVDLDSVLTVLAQGCYRWLGQQLKGYAKATARQLYRRFVETAGTVGIRPECIAVHLDRRSHNPIVREAALDREHLPIPWLQNRYVEFKYT